nr:VOC family protein [Actinomycetospora chiangmaiensis]
MVRLVLADGIGLELQQFGPTEGRDGLPVTRTPGVSHLCVQDPDVAGLADRIVAHGGRLLTGHREFFPGRKPFSLVYCADPFGNLIEIDSHSFETTYSPVSYPEDV